MKRMIATVLIAALAGLFACSSDDGQIKHEAPGKTVAKGDCPDCDPAGPSAFEQADMGLRFYLPGDRWQVAYQFKIRNDMAREALRADQLPDDPSELSMVQEDLQVTISDVFLFDYAVLSLSKRVVDNVLRDVAQVRVEQGISNSAQFSQDRIDTHEFALEFELDDLLRPLSETFYNREYPHGKRIEVDHVSSLSGLESGSSLYPHVVPRVLTAGATGDAPAMTAELEAIADDAIPGWRELSFRKYEFANGDLVFWAQGQLWPFYVDCKQGYGLLISQSLTER
jgi:hypothetical protein